ncbi:MAG TPA: threonine/serine dehydratase [Thermomicrobiales bacterium]|nr:threonine/serine dehydratase [Thermomicrobiales bacterium]
MFATKTAGGDGVTGSSDRIDANITIDDTSGIYQRDAFETADASWKDVTLDDVIAARERIMPYLHRTPLLSSATLSRMTNTELSLKAETFQRTCSFKARGALNAALQLTPEERERGVITISAGNHGQGLAFAASIVGTKAVVFMPETAVPTKVNAIREYGAEVVFAKSMAEVFPAMEAYREAHGMKYVGPYSDAAIIAGQGVVGLEILEDMPDVEAVVVPVGGGGLISGVALAIKSQKPDVRIIGVEPEGANIVNKSLKSGKLEHVGVLNTIADGLTAPFAGPLSTAVIAHYVDEMVLVNDDDIVTALQTVIERCKILVEPAGAASVAALMSGKAGVAPGTKTVALLSGGNIDRVKLKSIL